jgi:hypothetical protein
MSQGVSSLLRGVLASVIAAGILNVLPARPALAAECVLVPDTQPPAGMRWYLRTDPVKQRKCWSMGPKPNQATTSQAATPPAATLQTQMPSRSMMQPSPLKPIVSQRTMVRSLYGGEPPAGRGLTPQGGAMAGNRARSGAQDGAFGRFPDLQQPIAQEGDNAAANAADTQQPMTTDAQNNEATTQEAAAEDSEPSSGSTMQSIKLIALIAGALALAGIAGRAIVKASAGRWRQAIVARGVDWGAGLPNEDPVLPTMVSPPAADFGGTGWNASLPQEPSAFDGPRLDSPSMMYGGGSPVAAPPPRAASTAEPDRSAMADARDKDHVPTPEERLQEILRAWEPRAA